MKGVDIMYKFVKNVLAGLGLFHLTAVVYYMGKYNAAKEMGDEFELEVSEHKEDEETTKKSKKKKK